MKVAVDENIPRVTVHALEQLGHDVLEIRGTSQQGLPDDVLWAITQAEQRLLVTTDKGFVIHRDEPHFGILIIRLRQPNSEKIHSRVVRALGQIRPEEWPGTLAVIRDAVQSVWRRRK